MLRPLQNPFKHQSAHRKSIVPESICCVLVYSGEPRDHMNAEQLEHLSYLESTNITLIDMGMEYEQRKGELTRLSQRWLAKRLEAVNV